MCFQSHIWALEALVSTLNCLVGAVASLVALLSLGRRFAETWGTTPPPWRLWKLRRAGAQVMLLAESHRGPGSIVGKLIGPQLLVEIGEGGRWVWCTAFLSRPGQVSSGAAGHLSSHQPASAACAARQAGTLSKENSEDIGLHMSD